jgi:hypothetical protein
VWGRDKEFTKRSRGGSQRRCREWIGWSMVEALGYLIV